MRGRFSALTRVLFVWLGEASRQKLKTRQRKLHLLNFIRLVEMQDVGTGRSDPGTIFAIGKGDL